MTLYIQKQEKKLIAACIKLHIPYETRALEVADVQNEAGTLVAEVKSSANDFWASMVDRRVYAQIVEMYKGFKDNRYVFVKYKSLFELAKENYIDINWIYSLFGEAEMWGVNFREFHNHEDLARKLYSLDRKLGTERVVRDRALPVKHSSPAGERMVRQLPGIGKKLGKEVIKKCGSFNGFYADINGNMEILDSIKGLSKKGKILSDALIEMRRGH